MVQILFLMVVGSLFISTLVVVAMTVMRLMQPGTSPELKMAFLKRHGTYFFFYFIVVLGISEQVFPKIFKMGGIFFWLYNIAGIMLFFVRLQDTSCRSLSGKKRQANKFTKESLDSFLYSALNIEFVYIILIGINNFMDLATEKSYDFEK